MMFEFNIAKHHFFQFVRNFFFFFFCVFVLYACQNKKTVEHISEPKKVAQWFNPLFVTSDFDHELNFPLWFNDSLIKAHEIYKITKRVYGRIVGDTSEVNSYQQAIPKEKIEYYFDPNGLVDQVVIYMYYDDREIARINFIYEGNMLPSGYRSLRILPMISLTKTPLKDQFSTDFFADKTNQFSQIKFIKKKRKYATYLDLEKGVYSFYVPSPKNWGPLSIDSIIHPKENDWIIHGTARKPYKRYQVQNTVNEKKTHSYLYWNSGVLKSRIKLDYPFEYRRTFTYGKKHEWSGYVDSTFTENRFITRMVSIVNYDQYERPMEIIHQKEESNQQKLYYRETFYYRTRKTTH